MTCGYVAALGLVAGLAAGCNTPVGNYLENRARDFGECWRLQVGGGLGLGGGVKAAGLAHVGVLGGMVSTSTGVGWAYGSGYAFGFGDHKHLSLEIYPPLSLFRLPHAWEHPIGHFEASTVPHLSDTSHTCFALLPAVWSWSHDRRLWAHPVSTQEERWRHVHAFDVEVSAYAAVLVVRVGFSPGEFLDFLLGWFGVDIAGDDQSVPEHAED